MTSIKTSGNKRRRSLFRAFAGTVAFAAVGLVLLIVTVSLKPESRLAGPVSSVAAATVGGAVVRLVDDVRRRSDAAKAADEARRRELDEVRRLLYIGLYAKSFGFAANAAEIVGTLVNVLGRHPELVGDLTTAERLRDAVQQAVVVGVDSVQHPAVLWAHGVIAKIDEAQAVDPNPA